ncbi:MAG: 4Fe-4S dicluster domain-containing protein [Deltaproteobacteria bacterium]|nr:4Fe-4S dicluster domain-containing protein [Deltaproteobacteria bacterium]
MVKLTINDQVAEVPEGATVLEAARKIGVRIPTLCYYEAIKPYGGCRLCLVEVTAGNRTFRTASCTYPVSEGIQVVTDSELVLKRRRMVIDLLWSKCPDVPVLAEIARELGLKEPSFIKGKDDCILCGLCTRMCAELQGPAAIGIVGRGAKRQVMTPFGEFSQACRTCGACQFVCPTGHIKDVGQISGKTPKPKFSEFNACLDTRGNIYRLYPQAMPSTPAIDRSSCIQALTGECRACEKSCPAEAIDYTQQDVRETLEVGAVVLASGFQTYDPTKYAAYHYSKFPGVVTSLEFERILSASGPFAGHLVRPSDHMEPKKIAWLQCVGSRDLNHCDNSYCSAVCCMYAIKQAVIAKEHCKDYTLDTAIFFMDMRTHGKDFEKYYWRAEQEHGVRFIRSRVHSIDPVPGSDGVSLRFLGEDGAVHTEDFDMVILSVGLESSPDALNLAKTLGVEVNQDTRFARSSPFTPVSTDKPGVYVCGVFQGPKDIPQSVMEASAAAAAAGELLAAARGTELKKPSLPPERDVSGEEPRIGVFACNCGINIGGVIKIPELVEYTKTLPNVVFADENLFTCSADTQGKILEVIEEHRLNRVMVASCSPRTHAPMFMETIQQAGLNPYLFEMANIRDQDSWVHMHEPEKALEKAKDLVRGAVARLRNLEPLHKMEFPVFKSALVIGGGVAGMEAARSLGDMGFQVNLVEATDKLGGNAWNLVVSSRGYNYRGYLEDLLQAVQNHPHIQLMFNSQVTETSGFVGNFRSTVKTPQGDQDLEHGVTIMATGGKAHQPEEYLYGQDDRVMLAFELDQAIAARDAKVTGAKQAVFIQCVGSREPARPYCSRLCCTHSVESAIELKRLNPDLDVFILYRDMRTYGDKELLYKEARELGVVFIRFDLEGKPQVAKAADGSLQVTVTDPILGMPVVLKPDLLTLASAVLPNPTEELGELFKVSRNAEGFFNEAHAKLRPVDFPSDGIFLAGLAHYPKPIDETIAQAKAAAGRAATFLAQDTVKVGGVVAEVQQDKCAVCLTCVRTCPFNVPVIDYQVDAAYIDPAKCQGCGVCVSECPAKAIQLKHYTDLQIIAQELALAAG